MTRHLSIAAVVLLSGCSALLDTGGLAPEQPGTPADLAATAGNARATLTWTPSAGDVVRYDVYGGATSGALARIGEANGGGAASFVATGLPNGVTQYFAIAAVDSSGKASPLSSEASATPLAVPTVHLVSPGDDATNVDLDATLVVSFSHVVNPGSVTVSTIPPLDLGAPGWDADSTFVSFATSVAAETTYTVNVGCEDPAGNSTTASFHFTTIPVPPRLESFSPTNLSTNVPVNADVQLIFSEPMTAWDTSAGAATFTGITCTGWSWAGANTIATCSHANLAYNTTYTVTVGIGATDAGGNPLAQAKSFQFTTAAAPHTLAPQVSSWTPTTSATGVSRYAGISITFNEAVDKFTAQGAFTISSSGSVSPGGGTFSWSADGLTMTYQPPTQDYGSTVTWTMGTGLKCLGGINMASAFSRSYRVVRQGTVTLVGSSTLDGYLANNTTTAYGTGYYLYVGDLSDHSYLRGFLAFDLNGLEPSATAVTGATLHVWQYATWGSPYTALGGTLAQSVDYGTSLTSSDFETPVLTWTGMKCSLVCLPICRFLCTQGTWNDEYSLGTSVAAGWKDVDVTGKVERDRAARSSRGNRCQFRLKLPTNTNNDAVSDYAGFFASEHPTTGNRPKLDITYEYP